MPAAPPPSSRSHPKATMSIRREQLHHLRQPGAAKNDQAHENGGAGIGLGTMPRKVRFRGQSGKHMLSWRFSGFDPISECARKLAKNRRCKSPTGKVATTPP